MDNMTIESPHVARAPYLPEELQSDIERIVMPIQTYASLHLILFVLISLASCTVCRERGYETLATSIEQT